MANGHTMVQETREGEATVRTMPCGCEHVDAPTYDGWFPCSPEHTAIILGFNGKAAA